MIRALDITELIPTFTSLREFLKVFTTIRESQEPQPRYKIGWTSDEVTEFVAEVGVENSQLMSAGVIGSTDISYYSYIYKPTNALLLIYDTDY